MQPRTVPTRVGLALSDYAVMALQARLMMLILISQPMQSWLRGNLLLRRQRRQMLTPSGMHLLRMPLMGMMRNMFQNMRMKILMPMFQVTLQKEKRCSHRGKFFYSSNFVPVVPS